MTEEKRQLPAEPVEEGDYSTVKNDIKDLKNQVDRALEEMAEWERMHQEKKKYRKRRR